GTEKRELRAARVDIFETLARLERGSASGDHEVLRERRAVFHAEAQVFADGVADGRLKQKKLQRLGVFETQKIEIRETAELGRNLEVCTCVREKDSGIHEISLAFLFAGAQRRN